ncbi:MAG: helix-turn-helix transcriptional regulator [Clostridia bacterium]|nr:helix-turn-helix transcriptional regulator [Clostridia bacterium]
MTFLHSLSKELKIADSTISRWEKNLRVATIDNLYIVAKYFWCIC